MDTNDKNKGDLVKAESSEEIQEFSKISTNQVLDLIHRIAFQKKVNSEKGKVFPFAFDIDEKLLKKIEDKIRNKFDELNAFPKNNLIFTADVRFSDLTSDSYSSFAELLEQAGDKKDPERLILTYKMLLRDPIATEANIEIRFLTERKLDIEELKPGQHHLAKIDVTVGGPTAEWVRKLFDEILPYLEACKIGGIYRPLLIFRNDFFVHLITWVLGLVFWLSSIDWLSRIFKGPRNEEILDSIMKLGSIEKKIDAFLRDLYTYDSPISEPLFIFLGSALVLVLSWVILTYSLPLLVPRSNIRIGLADIRARRHLNVFKFVVFNVLALGIIVPILLKILF